jgi:hypothetical protein
VYKNGSNCVVEWGEGLLLEVEAGEFTRRVTVATAGPLQFHFQQRKKAGQEQKTTVKQSEGGFAYHLKLVIRLLKFICQPCS